MSADSAGGGNFNRYWYANNNPYKFTDPDGRVTVLVINDNTPYLGSHAGWAIMRDGKTTIYDPAGEYMKGGSRGNSSMVEDGSLEGYIAYSRREGSDVKVIMFQTTADEEAQILAQTETGNQTGGFCAVMTSQSLMGVGPFKDLTASWRPHRLAREAERLQAEAAARNRRPPKPAKPNKPDKPTKPSKPREPVRDNSIPLS